MKVPLHENIQAIKAQFDAQSSAAYDAHPHHAGVVQALVLYDDGILKAEAAMESVRTAMRLPRPVIAAAAELGCLIRSRQQSNGGGRDAASVPTS